MGLCPGLAATRNSKLSPNGKKQEIVGAAEAFFTHEGKDEYGLPATRG
jgi:hypothetical protein